MRGAAILVLLSASALGQTFTVGPVGANFTSIAAAVAAVPDGAVLLVQPGTYAPFAVTGKGISILGQGAVTVASAPFQPAVVTIANTAVAQRVVLRNLALAAPLGAAQRLECTNCQGAVSLQQITMDPTYGFERRLVIQQCGQVSIDGCGPLFGSQPTPAMQLDNSRVALARMLVTAALAHGLAATNCDVQLTECDVLGGGFGGPGILLGGTTLRVSAGCTVGDLSPTASSAGISGTGTVVFDPQATLHGTFAAPLSVVVAPQASVLATGGTIGTTANATLTGATGRLGALYLGLAGPPTSVPGFTHAMWLDPIVFMPVVVGVLGPLTGSVAVPNNPLLLGSLFAWQGIDWSLATGFAFSTPAWFAP